MSSRIVLSALILSALPACSGPGPSPHELTIQVGPEQVDCVGVAPMRCLRVKYQATGEWENFNGKIAGFEYEPGHTYTLLVSRETLDNPPADAPNLRLTLVKIVAKE